MTSTTVENVHVIYLAVILKKHKPTSNDSCETLSSIKNTYTDKLGAYLFFVQMAWHDRAKENLALDIKYEVDH